MKQQHITCSPALRVRPLMALTVAFLAGCPSGTISASLTTAMRPGAADAFGKLVAAYNDKHATTPIHWTNVASEADLASDQQAKGWAIASSATAQKWSQRASFTVAISPKLLGDVVKGFAERQQSVVGDTMLPLLARQPLYIADAVSVDSIPPTIGDLLQGAAERRRKGARYLFAPAFGDSDQVLRFLYSQGAPVAGPRGSAQFPAGELEPLLKPWVEAYRRGDLPKPSLDWDETAAARHLVAGEADIVLGGLPAVDVVAARPDKKSRRFNFFRPSSGVVEDQWQEPIGLVRLGAGSVSLADQNMIAFLLSKPVQVALGEGYEAVPLTKQALLEFAVVVKGATDARAVFLSSICMHTGDGVPLLPLDPNRRVLADALRLALKEAVETGATAKAVADAADWYKQHALAGT